MGRHAEANEIFRRLSTLTPPSSDPPVLKPQPPEQRAFFLAGYRLAMSAPETTADTGGAAAPN
jgi:hypothetical protein